MTSEIIVEVDGSINTESSGHFWELIGRVTWTTPGEPILVFVDEDGRNKGLPPNNYLRTAPSELHYQGHTMVVGPILFAYNSGKPLPDRFVRLIRGRSAAS